jgi:uncharacterized integral membrane protein
MVALIRRLIKTIIVVLLLVFTVYNFDSVSLKFTNLYIFEFPLAVIVLISFLFGFALGAVTKLFGRKRVRPRPDKVTL